jgi:flagellar motility protein MotE (MotC chaperone)
MKGKRTLLACVGLALLASAGAGENPEESKPREYGVTTLLEEIRAHRVELDRRARALHDRESQVEDLERLAMQRLAELEKLADTVESRIAAWEESNGDAVRQLAKIYSSMPPQRAAPLLEEMDVELATQLVSKMKYKDSAAVLSLLSQERALAMSRKVAHPLGMKPADVAKGGR